MLRGGEYKLRSRLVEDKFKNEQVDKKVEEPPIETTPTVTDTTTDSNYVKDKLIELEYYNPLTGFVGTDKLYHKLKSKGITRKDILHFLKRQEIVQITRKNNFKARSFIPPRPLYEFQVDLIYIDNSKLNNDSKYALTCVDIFTKVADVVLLKRKDDASVVEAMKSVLNTMGIPEYVYSDRGSEFIAKGFKELLKEKGIKQLFTIGHAAFIEVFNRTIKELLHRYLISTDTKTLTKVLPKILNNYNNSYHSTIKMTPNEATQDNYKQVYRNIVKASNTVSLPAIREGDKVRVIAKVVPEYTGFKKQGGFVKGYAPKFSKLVHVINHIEENRYYIDNQKDYYYRSQLRLANDFAKNPNKPDFKGTQEHHLKKLGKLRKELPPFIKPVVEAMQREKREKKKPNKLNL